jgi:predicted NAD-dependent protein-ADP-ribosyltransferase YbiA (DUF1768 family)
MKIILFAILFFLTTISFAQYPESWFKPVSETERQSWEILPQDAKDGEVILSKRTELGIFSNLSEAHFIFEGETYYSIESLWQMMKYPDLSDKTDERNQFQSEYPFKREEVKQLVGFECKKAGDAANAVMKSHDIKWISFQTKKFNYKDMKDGSEFHYQIISKAIEAKVTQNEAIKKLLIQTGDLKLRPDHKIDPNSPKAYFYFDILMQIRNKLMKKENK